MLVVYGLCRTKVKIKSTKAKANARKNRNAEKQVLKQQENQCENTREFSTSKFSKIVVFVKAEEEGI